MHRRVPRSAPARYKNRVGSYWVWVSSSSFPKIAFGETDKIVVPSLGATRYK
jgi:hypothetical protein